MALVVLLASCQRRSDGDRVNVRRPIGLGVRMKNPRDGPNRSENHGVSKERRRWESNPQRRICNPLPIVLARDGHVDVLRGTVWQAELADRLPAEPFKMEGNRLSDLAVASSAVLPVATHPANRAHKLSSFRPLARRRRRSAFLVDFQLGWRQLFAPPFTAGQRP